MNIRPYYGKISRNGSSLFVIVPSSITKYCDIQKGDIVEVSITKVAAAPKQEGNTNETNDLEWCLCGCA